MCFHSNKLIIKSKIHKLVFVFELYIVFLFVYISFHQVFMLEWTGNKSKTTIPRWLEQQMPCSSVASATMTTYSRVDDDLIHEPTSIPKGQSDSTQNNKTHTVCTAPCLMWLAAKCHTMWDSCLTRMSTKVTVIICLETKTDMLRCGLLQLNHQQVWLQVPD